MKTSLYIYCPRPSQGALELVHALGAHRLRRFDGQDFWNKKVRFAPNDKSIIICWGSSVPELDGIRVLNGLDKPLNKVEELTKLANFGISTVTIIEDVSGLDTSDPRFLGRAFNHQGGSDLLFPPILPDYRVFKEDFVKEYRIHSFDGRSIRAGIKVPRDGFKVVQAADWKLGLLHPWIRSFDAGWKINYDGFQSGASIRKLAHLSVKALNLTFGAVDIGERPDGRLKVLEVNRAPGIEGGSVASYVRAITRWIDGEVDNDVRGVGKGEPKED